MTPLQKDMMGLILTETLRKKLAPFLSGNGLEIKFVM
jgi:hypothetical protein